LAYSNFESASNTSLSGASYWFISDTNGDSGNDGHSSNASLPSSELVNITLSDNDTILFNKGEIYEHSGITITNNNITVKSYGAGRKPIIRGSTDVSGAVWIDNEDGTYTTTATATWVYIANQVSKQASTGDITVTGENAANQPIVSHSNVSGYSDIVGSTVLVRARDWAMDIITNVTSYDGAGEITLSDNLLYVNNFQKLQLLNDAEYFSSDNEWVYRGGDITVKSATSPTGLTIRRGTGTIGFTVTGDGFTLDGLQIEEYYRAGIKITGENPTIINSIIQRTRGTGIILSDSDGNSGRVQNCIIYDHGFAGIYCSYLDNLIIKYNTVVNIGMQSNRGATIDNSEVSIASASSGIVLYQPGDIATYPENANISYNYVYDIAYSGVKITGKSHLIHHNIIHDCMLKYKDGSGIYSYAAGQTSPAISNQSIQVYNNFVFNIGTNADAGEGSSGIGIYADHGFVEGNIHHNVVYICTSWVYYFNRDCSQNTIEDNIGVEPQGNRSAVGFRHDEAWKYISTQNDKNVMNRNTWVVRTDPTEVCITWEDDGQGFYPFDNGGSSDNNYFINPYADKVMSEGLTGSSSPYTFANYKTRFGTDANSTGKVNWLSYVDEATARSDIKLYTNKTGGGVVITAPSGYENIDGEDVSDASLTVSSYFGLIVLKSS